MSATAREAVHAMVPLDAARRLDIFADLLVRWQTKINLVAPSTVPDLWTRHIADSLQVRDAAPHARGWVDLGSGGGFPGLVTAILLADWPDARVHLVESDKRKAAFLGTVSRETGVRAIVHSERIETFVATHEEPVDAVSARALAPLPRLVRYAERFLLAGAVGVFAKGQLVDAELTELARDPRFAIDSAPSRTDIDARLIIVTAAREPRGV